jgi:2-oxoglutarate dehydrogenase E1 component
MGGWTFVRERIQDALRPSQKLAYAGRTESASTAVGSLRIHRQQQAELVAAAFAGLP